MAKEKGSPKILLKFFGIVFLSIAALLIGLMLAFYAFLSSWVSESYSEFQRIPTPDGKYEAVVFQIDMGAMSSFNRQVKIVKKGVTGNKGQTLFAFDGTEEPTINWLSDTELAVTAPSPGYRQTKFDWQAPWWGRTFTITGPDK